MKRVIKFISLLILCLTIIYPLSTLAVSEKTSYISINDTKGIEVGELSFSLISFKDYSLTSIKAFGLTGTLSNRSKNTITYNSIVYFYDKDYNLIAQSDNLLGMAISGENKFNHMCPVSILNNHDIKEVAFYSLSINYDENNILTESNLTPSKNINYQSYDYVIDKYNIDIQVNENNTFEIEETITVFFNIPKHGIVRTIPLKNIMTSLDGSISTFYSKITNVSVDNLYTSSKKSDSLSLQIGSPSQTLTGSQTYVIKYTYSLEKDETKDYDELYYNIVATEWDDIIGNVTFSIAMPKNFDSSKIVFLGSFDSSKMKYTVSESKIMGSYEGILDKDEGLTIMCELPKGYFKEDKADSNFLVYLFFLVFILILLIIAEYMHKNNKKNK